MEGVALVDEWLEGGEYLLAKRGSCMGERRVVGGGRGRSTMSSVHVV